MPFHYLFGPVLSRRMGRSLGVDLVPLKTCSYGCVFCQLGQTTVCTAERREYVPLADVLRELDTWHQEGGRADFVTIAGSGEPTLHTGFGRVLDWIRSTTEIRSALLTNGSLLCMPEVRADARRADVVKASLSAWDQASYERVNRPHPSLRFDDLVAGLSAFRSQFAGELWIEVFLMAGINDREEDVRRIAQHVVGIKPDRVHLNTAVRPAAEAYVKPLPEAALKALARLFRPEGEVTASAPARSTGLAHAADRDVQGVDESVYGLVTRHPGTAADVAEALGLDLQDAIDRLERMAEEGRVTRQTLAGLTHYAPPQPGAGAAATSSRAVG